MGMDRRQRPRADIGWSVIVQSPDGDMAGIMKNVSSTGVYISCERPLSPKEVVDMVIEVPVLNHTLKATAEVVWSGSYDPEDVAAPGGMGVRFIRISGAARKVISDAVIHHLKLEGIEPDDDTLEIVVTPIDE
jgi:hypothetical protein